MKLPISILSDYVETALGAEALGELLTMAGFELEGIERFGSEDVLDLKVVANRGDGLSALGIAREVLAKDPNSTATALYNSAVSPKMSHTAPATHGVRVETEACRRFACQVYDNVENGDSPQWLQDRLTAAGMRPISLLVDLTNYVMLERGQPLHAYDLDLLRASEIVVRQAQSGETMKTLDDVQRKFTPENMLICDGERAVGIAGVMGGLDTEVSTTTKRMLLESANFANTSIRKTRRQLNMQTEASYRFERSVDPEGVVSALVRFEELYREATGKSSNPGITDVYPSPPTRQTVRLRLERTRMILGIAHLELSDLERVLTRLGFGCVPIQYGFDVTVPTWRPDIALEEDLIEEVGRIYGYDQIPEALPFGHTTRGGSFGLYSVIDTSKKTMLRCGLDQTWSHTLRDEHLLDFNPARRVRVRNPHSPELSFLRSSLLPGLAEAAQRNGGRDFRFFEIGKVFVQGDYQVDESPELAIFASGNVRDPHWAQPQVTQQDFWTIKGMIEELGKLVKDSVTFAIPRLPDHRFHPTRQAGVMVDSGRLWVGTAGQIHPDYAAELNLPEATFMAEIDLLVFFQQPDAEVRCKAFSRNPSVRRDIAIVIEKAIEYAQIEAKIAEACGEELERQWLFDVYEGKGIEPGKHSLGIAMLLRKFGSNFTDEEANAVRDRVVNSLSEIGAVLR